MHVVDLKGLFTEINQEEVATNKAKQLENDVNDDDAFLRFEFLECVMRLANQVSTEDPNTSLPGTLSLVKPVFCTQEGRQKVHTGVLSLTSLIHTHTHTHTQRAAFARRKVHTGVVIFDVSHTPPFQDT
jgi:hypothetical protein